MCVLVFSWAVDPKGGRGNKLMGGFEEGNEGKRENGMGGLDLINRKRNIS